MRLFSFVLACLAIASSVQARVCPEEQGKSAIARVVAVDSTNAPVYRPASTLAEENTGSPLTLNEKEIVLTFDVTARSAYTLYILDILDRRCLKATFFLSADAIRADPKLAQRIAARGHTIGIALLPVSKKLAGSQPDLWKGNLERALSDIKKSGETEVTSLVRVRDWSPAPGDRKEFFAPRGLSLWGADVTAGPFAGDNAATRLANDVITKVTAAKRAVIAFDAARLATVDALDSVISNLQRAGFKVVHVVPATFYQPPA